MSLKLDPIYDDVLLFDGFEDALMGVVERINQEPCAVYDREKCIDILVERDGMCRADAEEYFSFNTEGAWVGERTPFIFTKIEKSD
jgi:hypothetical protein